MFYLKKTNKRSLNSFRKNIQYPNSDPSILIPFFKKLENAKFKKVRIMHYGIPKLKEIEFLEDLRETTKVNLVEMEQDYLLLYQPPEKSALIILLQRIGLEKQVLALT